MIGRLVGRVIDREPDQLLLEVGGVGYEVEIPLSTFYQLSNVEGDVVLYTHLVVREDAQLLFGFLTQQERTMFRTLIKVNGVGPKLALAILSGLEADAFASAIKRGDLKTLTGLPGVGKKTAERLVIEMKDKLDDYVLLPEVEETMDVVADAEAALIKLGYKPAEAALAVSQVEEPAGDIETLIKQALKQLMRA